MSAGLYFMKLELNYLRDSTFNRKLSDAQKWRYVQLYLLAKELNAGGAFIKHDGVEMDLGDIAYNLHITDEPQLQADMDAMKEIGFIGVNGHGPYLARFVKEQETPKTDAERKAEQRSRDTEKSHARHAPVTACDTESESDIESESESESEEESSVRESHQQPTDDDISLTDQNQTLAERKTEICKHAGIPSKYSSRLITNQEITPDDILSELARNYSKSRVKNPGYITGLNLSKSPPEKAAAEWTDMATWSRHLPTALWKKLGFACQSNGDELDTSPGVTTRKRRKSEVEEKVAHFLGGPA